jgi:translation initiation factor IF-2
MSTPLIGTSVRRRSAQGMVLAGRCGARPRGRALPLVFARAPLRALALRAVKPVVLPDYVDMKELSARLKMRVPDLVTHCQERLSWWPPIKPKVGLRRRVESARQFIFSFSEARSIADSLNRAVEYQSLEPVAPEAALGVGPSDLRPRPAVVSILGHVDHGKTTLLDKIRGSDVAAREDGKITQEIYSFLVQLQPGVSPVTFLDTPGHEEFFRMRESGALFADLGLLVVAADEGVKPQTVHALQLLRESRVPILVAVTKADLSTSKPHGVRQQLRHLGMRFVSRLPETVQEMKGRALALDVSALTGYNMDALRGAISRIVSLAEPTYASSVPATGAVVEVRHDSRRGKIIRAILTDGEIHCGDYFVCGPSYGRVKQLGVLFPGDRTLRFPNSATAGVPFDVMGVKSEALPCPGDLLHVLPEERCKSLAHVRLLDLAYARQPRLVHVEEGEEDDDAIDEAGHAQRRTVPVIVKANNVGALEVMNNFCRRFKLAGTVPVSLEVVDAGVGRPTLTDVHLASKAGAFICSFRSPPPTQVVQASAHGKRVLIHNARVFYDLTDFVRSLVSDAKQPPLPSPESVRVPLEALEAHLSIFLSAREGCV